MRLIAMSAVLFIMGCSDEMNVTNTTNTTTATTADKGNFDPNHILQVEIEIDPDDWDTLRHQERTITSILKGEDCMDGPFDSPYTYFHADVTIDGQTAVDSGVRKKGLIGSQSTTKPGLKLNIDEYVEGAELFGVDNITLNNSVQDPSLIRQCMGYAVFEAAGIPASKCNFARVAVNSEDYGIYVHVEPVKRAFLRDRFGDDSGDLYEGTLSDFRENWVNTFDPKTGDTETALTGPIAIKDALTMNDDDFLAQISTLIDLDAYINFWATEILVSHWDGYAGNNNNFFIYRNPADNLFHFIPWGVDGVMYADTAEYAPFVASVLPSRLLDIPETYNLLEARINVLLDTVWDEEALLAEVDRMENLLADEVSLSSDNFAQIDDVRTYITTRKAGLLAALPGETYYLDDGSICMSEIGTLNAEFSTTWGSLNTAPDITVVGDLDMEMVWDDYKMVFTQQGVAVGTDDGQPLLVLAAIPDYDSSALLLPYFVFDKEQMVDGAQLSVGSGAILYTDSSLHGYLVTAGYMGDGAVSIETGSTGSGDLVQGTITATIYGWE